MNISIKILFTLFIALIFSQHVYSDQESESSTIVGSAIGATLGSVIGYQFGGGHGKYATTALGALGGYYLGGKVQDRFNDNQPDYQPEYSVQDNTGNPAYIGNDDYMIKQHLSNERKRRNMIRNGERDPLEMPYDTSEVQTSWDDPNN